MKNSEIIKMGDVCFYPYKKIMIECLVVRKNLDIFSIKPLKMNERIVRRRGYEKALSTYQVNRFLVLGYNPR